jgi:predicted GNAT family N-acyltransferase
MDYLVRFASTPEDRDAAYALRRSVFEEEQGIPRPLDRDPHDFNADHVVAFDAEGRCIGTGRIVRLDQRTCQVGRQATAPSYRKSGVGAAVLGTLERMARMRGVAELTVHAQLPAEPFYRSQGFERGGEPFVDQGVPHVLMRKSLRG